MKHLEKKSPKVNEGKYEARRDQRTRSNKLRPKKLQQQNRTQTRYF